jgi:DNA processing protein
VDKYSSGCNDLIKQRSAALIETAEDVIRELNWTSPLKRKARQQNLFAEMPAEQKALMKLLGIGELLTAHDISIQSGLRIQDVHLQLLELEMAGLIECLPGGYYRRKGPQ